MSTTRRLVDVIVVGGHAGPLAAACLLARRGYKVLHVEHDGLEGGYQDAGLRLPLGPELLPGPKSSPVIAEVMKALALVTDAGRVLRHQSPDLQVLAPGHRFDLPHEKAARARELRRDLGEAAGEAASAALDALLDADAALDPFLAALPPLPPDGFGERRELARAARGVPLDRPTPLPPTEGLLGEAVATLGRLSTYLAGDDTSPLRTVRSTARLLHGVHRLDGPGAWGGYASLLHKRFGELGGVSVGGGNAVAEEILVESGRVAGLKVLGDASDYRCRFLVSGVDAAVLRRLIPLGGRRKRYDSTLDSIRPREVLFTVNLVLRREGWPVGLGEVAIHLAGDTAPEIARRLVLQRFDAITPEGPDPSRVVLQASCFIPASRRDLGDAYLEEVQGQVQDVIRSDLMPFLDRHLVAASSPYLARRGPARGARLVPHPLLETDRDAAYGVGVLPPRTPYKNLVLAGREVVPGLGLEGELLAGWRAAEIVAGAARRHDPLKDQ